MRTSAIVDYSIVTRLVLYHRFIYRAKSLCYSSRRNRAMP